MNLLRITPSDKKLLENQIKELEQKASDLMSKLAQAANFGGSATHGIPEYRALEYDLKLTDAKIGRLKELLDEYTEMDFETISPEPAGTYSLIMADNEHLKPVQFYIQEVELLKGRAIKDDVKVITPTSPLGRAFLGSSTKQGVSVQTPTDEQRFKITDIKLATIEEILA